MILNPIRRESVDDTGYQGRTIPASKAGGIATYGAGAAAWEWCQLEWRDDGGVIYLNEGTSAIDLIQDSELSPEETVRLRREAATFTDVTEGIFQQLIEAERLATTEDFADTTLDMGIPEGYVMRLHHIWKTRAALPAGVEDGAGVAATAAGIPASGTEQPPIPRPSRPE